MRDKNRRNVFLLGLTSFFNDISSETIFALLPLYVGSASIVGFLGGIIHGLGELTKVYFGYLSDRMGKREPLVVAGYLTSIVAKFVIPFISKSQLFIALMADRLGKGIREGPRDAIISLSRKKGWAFGMQKAMDTAGAVLGGLIAFLFVYFQRDYRTAMIFAAYVGVLSLVPLVFVRVPKIRPMHKSFTSTIRAVPKKFRKFEVVAGLFGLALISPIILIKTSYEFFGATGLLIYVAFNIVYALSSELLGSFSDKVGRQKILSFSFGSTALAFLFMYFGGYAIIPGFLVYGLSFGAFRSTAGALVSEISGSEKATSLGLFQTILGLSIFFGSTLFGVLIDLIGGGTYLIGSVVAITSLGVYKMLA